MPVIKDGSQDKRVRELDARTNYSAYLIYGQALIDGDIIHNNFTGRESSILTKMKEGPYLFTPDELAYNLLYNRRRKDTVGPTVSTRRGIVDVIAGSGDTGFDNENGSSATFYNPRSLVRDSAGYTYVCDTDNNVIRVISPTGDVTTYAGRGTAGLRNGNIFDCDFNLPEGIVIDSVNNIMYIADTGNNAIRKINMLTGQVTTFGGSSLGIAGYADSPSPIVGGNNNTLFNHPTSLAVDAQGNLYVADTFNNKIRKIDPSGVVTTIPDPSTASYSFSNPKGITVDSEGNVYVIDAGNDRVCKISMPSQNVTVVSDGSSAVPAWNLLNGICIDSSGNIFVTDSANNSVYEIDSSGLITTIIDGSSSDDLSNPTGISIDNSGNLIICDSGNNRIVEVIIYTVPNIPAGYSVPDAPTALSAGAGDSVVGLYWTAPTNTGGLPINYYTISGTTASVNTQDETPFISIGNLTNGTTYTFSVKAVNSIGESAAVTIYVIPFASGGSGGVVTGGGTSGGGISGGGSSGGGSSGGGSSGGGSSGGGTGDASGGGTGGDASGGGTGDASGGGTSGGGTSGGGTSGGGSSGGGGTSTIPLTLPDTPTILNAVAGDRTVSVVWTAPSPAVTDDSAITGYCLQIVKDNAQQTLVYSRTHRNTNFLSATVSALRNGTDYIAKVFSLNNLGFSSTPATYTFRPFQNISTEGRNEAVKVYWTVPFTMSPITGYVINVTDSSGNLVTVPTMPVTVSGSYGTRIFYLISNLINGKLYNFSVNTITTDSELSIGSSATGIPDYTAPNSVTSLSVTPGNASATLTWSKPGLTADGSPVTGYEIYYYFGTIPGLTILGPIYVNSSASTVSYTINSLINTTTQYTFTVRSYNTSAINPENLNFSSQTASAQSYVGPPNSPMLPFYLLTSKSGIRYGNRILTVTWAGSITQGPPIQGYYVYYSGTTTPATSAILTPSATTADITLKPNGSLLTNGPPGYSFDIVAYNSVGNSIPATTSIEYSDNTTPNPVDQATITITNVAGSSGSLDVSWLTPAPTSDGSVAEYYLIYAYTYGTITATEVQYFQTNSTTQRFTFSGSTSTSYIFVIYSVNASYHTAGTNNSAGTSTANIPFIPEYVTAAPSITSLTPNHQSAIISWTVPTNGVVGIPAIDYYTITYTNITAGTAPQSITAPASSVTATVYGLTNANTYSFRITTRNSAGNSPASNSSAIIPDVTAPGPPTGLAPLTGNYFARIAWTPPVQNTDLSPIDGYEIQLYDINNILITTATSEYQGSTVISFPSLITFRNVDTSPRTMFNTYGLTNIIYKFTIRAYSTSSISPNPKLYSSLQTVQTTSPPNIAPLAPSLTVPLAPSPPNPTPFNTYAIISWTAPVDNPANGIPNKTGYSLTAAGAASFTIDPSTPLTASSSSVKITGLTNGQSYTFYLRAVNAASADGVSSALPFATITVRPDFNPPGPVTNLQVLPGNACAKLTWTAPTPASAPSGDLSPATQYLVSYVGNDMPQSTGSFVTVSGAATVEYTFPSLTNNTINYTFSVYAQNIKAHPAAPATRIINNSTVVNTTPIPVGPPNAPFFKLVPGDSRIKVKWLPSTQQGGTPVTGYKIYQDNAGTITLLTTIADTGSSSPYTYEISPLVNGTTYKYIVVAYNSINNLQTFTSPAGTQQLFNESPWPAFPSASPKSPCAPDGVDDITGNIVTVTQLYNDTSARVQLSWIPPVNDGGLVITKYLIRYYRESVVNFGNYHIMNTGDIFVLTTQTRPPNSTPVTYTLIDGVNGVSLTYNTKYKYTVSAINDVTNYGTNRSSFIINSIDTYDPINDVQESEKYPFPASASGIAPRYTRWPDAPTINNPTIQYSQSAQSTNTATVSWIVPPIYGKPIEEYKIQIYNYPTGTSVLGGAILGVPQPDYLSVTDSSIINVASGQTATFSKLLSELRTTPSNLIDGQSYTFKVAASITPNPGTTEGSLTYSIHSSPITPFSIPGAATVGTITPINTGATIDWAAPSSAGGGIRRYKIYVYSRPASSYIRVATTLSFPANPIVIDGTVNAISGKIITNAGTTTTITGLANNVQYYFTVVSSNDAGDSISPASVDSTIGPSSPTFTPDYTAPTVPVSVSATSAIYAATITWTSPTVNVDGSPVNGYTLTLYYDLAGGWANVNNPRVYPLSILLN